MEVTGWLCLCLLLHCIELASSLRGKLLFSNSTSIMEFDVATQNVTPLIEHAGSRLFALDFDYSKGYVYFPRALQQEIMRFPYTSTNRTLQTVVKTGLLPVGLAVDSVNEHVYWIEYYGFELYRCNMDGTNITVLSTLRNPFVIRLDVTNRWIYILETQPTASRILKSRFDIAITQTIVNLTTHVLCMAIDNDENRLYWMIDDGDIQSAKDDGSDVKTILSTNVSISNCAIDVFGSYVYYAYGSHLLLLNKAQETQTVLCNYTSRIDGIFVFKSGRNNTKIWRGIPLMCKFHAIRKPLKNQIQILIAWTSLTQN
ncbi:LRP1 [Mytilus coruscus]|uniref:LRP1 n=1 Tax=Mytilus coruscus TaxID=42192 RepID=A0A6J8E2P4_MYTCO|nr:LRP1 [Mytilus coruscus]